MFGDFDGLYLPGGQPGSTHLKNDQRVQNLVQDYHTKGKLVTAICAAPTVLHAAGVLDGKKVTSYPSEEAVFTGSTYVQDKVVQDGTIVTSRGVGTAIEFGLHLIETLLGREVKQEQANRILWPE
jgi:4-methyl-5(b-hydroxyethyl)-thiazole monophosphate biosynthesis